MAVPREQVQIQRPCPVKLDPARAANGVRSWHCGHCDKAVHVLSNMTEAEARAFMSERAGQDVCVTYAVRKDGSIRFAPEPAPVVAPVAPIVPIGALTRRNRVAAAAAVGLGVALAACTPHDNAKVVRPSIVVADTPVPTPSVPAAAPEEPEEFFDGELAAEPVVPGQMIAAPIPPAVAKDEPCEPKDSHPPMKRGRMKSPDR